MKFTLIMLLMVCLGVASVLLTLGLIYVHRRASALLWRSWDAEHGISPPVTYAVTVRRSSGTAYGRVIRGTMLYRTYTAYLNYRGVDFSTRELGLGGRP